jgi:hypothetical protein
MNGGTTVEEALEIIKNDYKLGGMLQSISASAQLVNMPRSVSVPASTKYIPGHRLYQTAKAMIAAS